MAATTAVIAASATPQSLINSASGGGSSVLDKIFNFATSKFDTALDYTLDKLETDRLIKLRRAETEAEAARGQNLLYQTQLSSDLKSVELIETLVPALLIGGFAIGALLILKK